MKGDFFLRSLIRRGSARVLGFEATIRLCRLGSKQPLILIREPSNPVDACAVRCTDLMGGSVGYVASEDACVVSARIIAGDLLMARTDGPCECRIRRIVIWSEGMEEEQKTKKTRKRKLEDV